MANETNKVEARAATSRVAMLIFSVLGVQLLTYCAGKSEDDDGASKGGKASGGASSGGTSNGGTSTGGISTGGISTGGISTGGISTGGISTGGTGGSAGSSCFDPTWRCDGECDYAGICGGTASCINGRCVVNPPCGLEAQCGIGCCFSPNVCENGVCMPPGGSGGGGNGGQGGGGDGGVAGRFDPGGSGGRCLGSSCNCTPGRCGGGCGCLGSEICINNICVIPMGGSGGQGGFGGFGLAGFGGMCQGTQCGPPQ